MTSLKLSDYANFSEIAKWWKESGYPSDNVMGKIMIHYPKLHIMNCWSTGDLSSFSEVIKKVKTLKGDSNIVKQVLTSNFSNSYYLYQIPNKPIVILLLFAIQKLKSMASFLTIAHVDDNYAISRNKLRELTDNIVNSEEHFDLKEY
jgi:hypothetical protein